VRQLVIDRVSADVDRDRTELDELARSVLAEWHSFDMPVWHARDFVLERVGIELDLFALRYQPSPSSLGEQLSAPRYTSARMHWEKANRFLVAQPLDLENAVKEAVSMVEALAKMLTGDGSATLGECITSLQRAERIPPLLAKSLHALWGAANQEAGVRHAQNGKARIGDAQARYLVESAHAGATMLLQFDVSAA
jgi:hypothetical protein